MGLDPSEAEDHVCEEGAPAWLATMGDLMSLLLVFFVRRQGPACRVGAMPA